ncbi:MAG: GNAT family N-acetyltransferase [Thermomicrobiales bacterium]
MLLTLQAPLVALPSPDLPAGYSIRPTVAQDVAGLGALYFTAYDPGIGCATELEAIADMQLWLSGGYGEAWLTASPVIVFGESIVASVQIVRSVSWADVPSGPFITEVFTDRDHRRKGLARGAMIAAMAALRDAGEVSVALRVLASNPGARVLYASLGFRSWEPE